MLQRNSFMSCHYKNTIMKSLLVLISSFILLVIFSASSCKKPHDVVKTITEVPIGTQTLADTKATFQGKWKLHYSIGGYTGNIRVNYPNTILLFTTTDSLYRWDNNVQTIKSVITYRYEHVYISNYSTFMLEILSPNNVMFPLQVAFSKKGDTLILAEPHTNPDKHYLTMQ